MEGRRAVWEVARHNQNPDVLTTVTMRDPMNRYGAIAEADGDRLESEKSEGQPTRLYRKGSDVVQLQIGHGRGNDTMKVNFGRWH